MASNKLFVNSTLPLPNSQYKIPMLGFGVFQSPAPTCVASCLQAFKAGYRHIDTAKYYGNENSVGRAIRESNLPRNELFVTSKILYAGIDLDSTYKMVLDSVAKLDGPDGYVDLFLIHSPNGGAESRKLMWLALEKAKEEGRVRDIGVSNYGWPQIEEIKKYGKVWPPAVNQIELHPWCQQREIVEYCKKNNIVIEAYCPIVRNQKSHDKTLVGIADALHKTPNQILIRYGLQKGWVPLPKSDTPARITSNADVYGFQLSDEDMVKLDALDRGRAGAIVQAVNNQDLIANLPGENKETKEKDDSENVKDN
ncbi:NADP-dependent oxidoreductase domain-containing protein [Clohesyomyces aquaticus]|uniref:NADP-dependent oxidoreductase domain-containing protein n=1 Tax=Clohesyomyces aquaticus TaxID=1231657 RepID=A0A1Y1YHU8_9PLEO|nr:NADP-dependent oxidoreductase domain-containing protein [Clohesyomyces aquaticus]